MYIYFFFGADLLGFSVSMIWNVSSWACISQHSCLSCPALASLPYQLVRQNVNMETLYHSPPFISTRSYALNSLPISFFLAVRGNHSLMRRVVPGGSPYGICGGGTEE